MTESDFDYENALNFEINDGCIKCIWFEECSDLERLEREYKNITEYGFCINFPGLNALIEFTNGKKMIISQSEWCTLYFIYNAVTNIK
jgi:hypothetical protein